MLARDNSARHGSLRLSGSVEIALLSKMRVSSKANELRFWMADIQLWDRMSVRRRVALWRFSMVTIALKLTSRVCRLTSWSSPSSFCAEGGRKRAESRQTERESRKRDKKDGPNADSYKNTHTTTTRTQREKDKEVICYFHAIGYAH